jgi:hypothetical protein
VIVLERGYDQKAEAAWVKVGISKKTMAGAQNLKNALAGMPDVSDKQTAKNEGGGVMLPGSHCPLDLKRVEEPAIAAMCGGIAVHANLLEKIEHIRRVARLNANCKAPSAIHS